MEKPKRRGRGRPKGWNGPYALRNRLISLAHIDGRTKSAFHLKQVRQMLTDDIGGNPTFIQRLLIDRAAVLSLRLALADERIVEDRLVEYDHKALVAWQNALTRTLVALGVQADAAPALSTNGLADVMRELEPEPAT